jgi:cytochrome c oxidase subunit III
MIERDAAAAEELPIVSYGPGAPVWWAVMLLLLIDVVVFATLVSAYLYLRFHSPEWPPRGVPLPGLLLPGLAVLAIAASSAAVEMANRGLRAAAVGTARLGMTAAAGLGLAFLALQGLELAGTGFRWDDHVYGSLVWTIVVFHAAHVATLVGLAVPNVTGIGTGYEPGTRFVPFAYLRLGWHFVTIAWLGLSLMLYLVPRWS